VTEPSGSPPGLANRNRKHSLTVTPNRIPNPNTSPISVAEIRRFWSRLLVNQRVQFCVIRGQILI